MRRIAICSSSRFYAAARAVAERLESDGFDVYTPSFDHDETRVEVDVATKAMLTRSFLDKVAAADAIYVVAGDGYIGRSVALEIGYATALSKPVYLSETPEEDAIKALTTQVIPITEINGARLRGPHQPQTRAA